MWPEFYAYLKPIIDIERPDRDDVFRKSNKFDRPDFGNNIPFELFSALTSLHMSHKQEADKDDKEDKAEKDDLYNDAADFKDEDHDAEGEGPQSEEKSEENETETVTQPTEEVKHDRSHDEVTVDVKTVSENPPDSQERVVPQEIEVRLKHSKSIEEQVIETRQDQDLIQEREEAKHQKEEALKAEEGADPAPADTKAQQEPEGEAKN